MMQMPTGPPQPFLGRNSLAIGMSDQVNQQRCTSAANHRRQPRLPSRGRRCSTMDSRSRTAYPHLSTMALRPILSMSKSKSILQQCVLIVILLILHCLLSHMVHFWQENNVENMIFYRFLRESWNAQLESYHLLYTYELPFSTPVTTLIQCVDEPANSLTAYFRNSCDLSRSLECTGAITRIRDILPTTHDLFQLILTPSDPFRPISR